MIKRGLKHLSRVSDVLFRTLRVERDITIFPDDVFLTSYPRSGNTWTRFLVGNLVYQQEAVTFLNVERLVPDMYKHSDRTLRNLPRPRILKSHDCFDPRYKKIIYIVRDPRDVTVSAYHYSMKVKLLPDSCPIEEFVPKFMSGTFGSGLLADPRWGSWYDNVASWLAMRHNRKFLLLRYEDMLENPQRELSKVAAFLNLETSPTRLAR